ncbi:hypothetical protein CR513_56924, partial [Mucuna pruriens]
MYVFVLGFKLILERITPHCSQTYLKGATNLLKSDEYKLKGYSDADFIGDRIERKSTSRGCHFIFANLVSWTNKRQGTISLCATEAEYISAAQCSSQLLWIKYQTDIFESNVPLLCENIAAIILSKTPILNSRAKHIEIEHHFIRDYLIDIFAKPLLEDELIHIRNIL